MKSLHVSPGHHGNEAAGTLPLTKKSSTVHGTVLFELLKGGRAVWRAVHDGPTAIARPRDKLFEESVGLLHKLETSFEGLKENPDPSAKQRNGISHPDQKDEPEDGEKGVLVSHDIK